MFFFVLKYGRSVELSSVSGLLRQSVPLFLDVLLCYFETLGVGLIYNRVRVRGYQSFICFTEGILVGSMQLMPKLEDSASKQPHTYVFQQQTILQRVTVRYTAIYNST